MGRSGPPPSRLIWRPGHWVKANRQSVGDGSPCARRIAQRNRFVDMFGSHQGNSRSNGSLLRLETDYPVPEFVRVAVRTTFPLPQCICALTQVLI